MSETADSGESKVLTFEVGGGEFGIALPWVCAVEHTGSGKSGNGGEIEYRGESLPLVDLGLRLKSTVDQGGGSSLLIVGLDRPRAALRIDRPGKVIDAGGARKWPECCRPFVEGVFEGILPREDRLLLLVDPDGVCRAASGRGEWKSQGGEGE